MKKGLALSFLVLCLLGVMCSSSVAAVRSPRAAIRIIVPASCMTGSAALLSGNAK